MLKEYNKLTSAQIYKLMSQTVIPRPIAWIVTQDEDILNVAPFSYFIPLSSKPATLIVSIGHKEDKTPKDTLANIRKNRLCTICFVNEENLEDMKKTALSLPKDESEVKKYNLKTKEILEDFPPIISSTKTAFFCELNQELDLGGDTIPLLLHVKAQYIDDEIIDSQDNISLDNIARVGKSFAKLQMI